MTDTAAHPSLLERAKEWIRHEAHAHNARTLVVDLVAEFGTLKERLAKLETDFAALAAKDAPMVKRDVAATEAVAAQDVKDAAAVVADVQKAAGA